MNLFKSFSVYVVNNILNALIPFFLIPVLTSYLSPGEYGILANVQVFITFTLPFVMLAIHGAVNTAYFRNPREEFPSYVSSAFTISTVSSVIVLIVLLLFSPLIRDFLEIPPQWVVVIPAICLFQTICTVTLVVFQARKEPVKYGMFQVGMTLTNFSLSILFIAGLGIGWPGRILGMLSSFFIFLIIGLWVLKRFRYLTFNISRAHVRDALWFGLPLIPHTISGPIIQMLDRPVITHFSGLEAAGLYTLAFQIAISVNYAAEAFNKAWVPHLFENLSSITPEKKKKMVKQSYLFMGFFMCLPLLLWLVTPVIFSLFVRDASYHAAQMLVLPISVGAAFGGMYYVVNNYIFYEKKTWMLAIVTLTSAALSVVSNLLLVPRYGATGAAFTFMGTNVIMFVAVWIVSSRVYPMPWFSFMKK